VSEKNLSEPQETRNELFATLASSRVVRLIRHILIHGGPVIALLLLGLYLQSATPYFWTESNLVNVARRTSVLVIFAVGQTFVILTGGIDLSVGATAALAGSVSAVTMTQQVNVFGIKFGPVGFFEGLVIALLVGAGAGLLNGLLITRGRIPDFIATLGTLEAFRGVALLTTNGLPVPSYYTDAPKARNFLPSEVIALGSNDWLGIPIAAWLGIGVTLVSWIILKYTAFGRSTFAVGGNREAARVSGINIERTKIGVYVVSALTAALAGFVLMGRLNSANALMASEENLNSIASVVIGGTNLFGGEGGVFGSIIGALTIGVIGNGLNLLNVTDFYQRIIQGSIIVVVVIFDQWRRRRFGA
jgi:ribose/xylose/arabinose/galactoside ABC-type transport system permease subunit